MSAETFPIYTDGLLSKWGLGDGDCLDDLLWDWEDAGELPKGIRSEVVLVRVVREFVLPVIEQDVEVYEILTNHNPIRAIKVDGVEIDTYTAEPTVHLTPDVVNVPLAEIKRIALDSVGVSHEDWMKRASGEAG